MSVGAAARRELQLQLRARSSGPGGQNVNKVESKAVLRWDVARAARVPARRARALPERFARRITVEGVLVLASQRHRERERNVADCLAKLARDARGGGEAAEAAPARPAPGRGARERRLAEKRHASRRKAERRRREE